MAKSVSAGARFQNSALVVMAAAMGTMFVLGGASLFATKTSKTAAKPAGQQHSRDVRHGPEIVVATAPAIAKPVAVTLAGSTDKLHSLFRKIGYELDGVRERGEVPRLFLASLLILSTLSVRSDAQFVEEVLGPKPGDLYTSYVELGGIGGDFPETGTTFLFTPLWQTESELFFADLRGLYNDQGETEGNWGLGYRKMISPDTIFGVYGYYDQRNTEFNNTFRQGTLGMEILRVRNEARWNVYIPGDNQEEATPVAFIAGGTINVAQGFEAAYYGTDFEYGHLLWDTPNGDTEL